MLIDIDQLAGAFDLGASPEVPKLLWLMSELTSSLFLFSLITFFTRFIKPT